ncbi:MAG: hypothetical protein WCJ95_17730 [Mariniphaga sp.]
MTKIDSLTNDEVINGELPLIDLLDNSFYYPSCRFDGGIIKHYSKYIQSFIYCDYAIVEDDLIKQLDTFSGYKLLGDRSVKKMELFPLGWQVRIPAHFDFDIDHYNKFKDGFEKPFQHWAVYERLDEFNDNHGPKKFSLLYIGREAVSTYQALYWANRKTAKVVAIIQSSGLNWTDFTDKNGPLAWVVLQNKYGTPETIFYGGFGKGYDDFNWKEYEYEDRIRPYYTESGEVTIWKKK